MSERQSQTRESEQQSPQMNQFFAQQMEAFERGQRILTRSTMIPIQQAMDVQWNVGEMLLGGLELTQSLQRVGTDITRSAVQNYLSAFENATDDLKRQAGQAMEGTGQAMEGTQPAHAPGAPPAGYEQRAQYEQQRMPGPEPTPQQQPPPPQQQAQQQPPAYQQQRGPPQQAMPPQPGPMQQPPAQQQRTQEPMAQQQRTQQPMAQQQRTQQPPAERQAQSEGEEGETNETDT